MSALFEIVKKLIHDLPESIDVQVVDSRIKPILFRISNASTLEKGAVLRDVEAKTKIDLSFLTKALDDICSSTAPRVRDLILRKPEGWHGFAEEFETEAGSELPTNPGERWALNAKLETVGYKLEFNGIHHRIVSTV